MNLLIDIGNTRIKLGYATATGARNPEQTLALTPAELPLVLPWLQQQNLNPSRALIVSVAALEVEQQVSHLLESLHCPARWIHSSHACPLVYNGYDRPDQLGADRWLALIGVLAQHQSTQTPIIHASFGTATTVDTVLPKKTTQAHDKALFSGGLILPGPQLMSDSLALNTAKLGQGLGQLQDFPSNTRAAISTGIASAQAGAVLRQWQLAQALGLGAPRLVCSGGGWELVQLEMEKAYARQQHQLHLALQPIYQQPTPVLDGLAYMATQY